MDKRPLPVLIADVSKLSLVHIFCSDSLQLALYQIPCPHYKAVYSESIVRFFYQAGFLLGHLTWQRMAGATVA